MKPDNTFEAAFTVPNYHQQLSASRPVQVYTYIFDTDFKKQRAGKTIEPKVQCGKLHRFGNITTLMPHNHEHHEIALITAGAAQHRTTTGSHAIRRGSVLAVAPNDVHSFDAISNLQMINCTYLTSYLFYDVREILSVPGLAQLFFHNTIFSETSRSHIPEWRLDENAMAQCLYELKAIADERSRDDVSAVLVRRTLEKLMLLLHRAYVHAAGTETIEVKEEVKTALEVIEESIAQEKQFDVSKLACELGFTRDYFARIFRQATGRTPTDYYQHRRVEQACSLLLDANNTATDVAHALGYYDSAHFCKLFKRYRGMSPHTFQRRYGESQGSHPKTTDLK